MFSIIGLSFLYEMTLVHLKINEILKSTFVPNIPSNSMLIIMSVLGAVVMPHNLFLHSETIQSQRIPELGEQTIERRLKYEFFDTLFSMLVGWMINSAMIILAAEFFKKGIKVTELNQASELLVPLLGENASVIFAIALLFAGISSSITAGMAGASIFTRMFKREYDIKEKHTKWGLVLTLIGGLTFILFIKDSFKALIVSQMLLSIQLPITIFLQIYLTSSKKVMGKYKNKIGTKTILWLIGIIVTILNIMLLFE